MNRTSHHPDKDVSPDVSGQELFFPAHKNNYDIDIQACSSMDCTGLIPSLPQSFAEVEHYNDLYQFLPEHVSDPEE